MEKTTKRKPKEEDDTLAKLTFLIMRGEPFTWVEPEDAESEEDRGEA